MHSFKAPQVSIAVSLIVSLSLFACDDKASGADPKGGDTETGASDDVKKPDLEETKNEGPEVQSCVMKGKGCLEYRTAAYRRTPALVKKTCEGGAGVYSQKPCSKENVLGRCIQRKGEERESIIVMYKAPNLKAELAAHACKGGVWEAAE